MNAFRTPWITNGDGATAVEFALVAPILTTVLLGVLTCGLVLERYGELNNGTRASARALALSRGSATPWSSITAASPTGVFAQTAPSIALTGPSAVVLVISVNGQTCTSDAQCSGYLASALGTPVSVTATYGCNLSFAGFSSGCTLHAQSEEVVE